MLFTANDGDLAATQREDNVIAAGRSLSRARRELDNIFLVVVEDFIIAVAGVVKEDVRAVRMSLLVPPTSVSLPSPPRIVSLPPLPSM